ncbi:MAG TPA: 30S ribosome-binding factor RbfA [Alphaproteobacteria bacterium]|nr:30S ribosome-binding factor RbfA [Alphaproteobacteria bacterium]
MTRQHLKPQTQRQQRVGEEVRHALARIFERGHFRDPDLMGISITVTEVRVSPDLRHATAFVLPFGGGDTSALVKGLRRAASYLRAQLAREIQLRYLPELVFEADTSFDRAAQLDRLLHSPAVARDLPAHDMRRDLRDGAEDEDSNGS